MNSRAEQKRRAQERDEEKKQKLELRRRKAQYSEQQYQEALQRRYAEEAAHAQAQSHSSDNSPSDDAPEENTAAPSMAAKKPVNIKRQTINSNGQVELWNSTKATVQLVWGIRRASSLAMRGFFRGLSFIVSKYFLYLILAIIALLIVLPPLASDKVQGADDPYGMLGVSRNATNDEVAKAFRKLALKVHPDRNKDNPDAQAKYVALTRAKEILQDPKKRANFDEFGHPDGPVLFGVALPAFLVRRDRGFVVFYVLMIVFVASTPVLYWFCGGATPSFETQPPAVMVKQMTHHMQQADAATEAGDMEQFRAHLRASMFVQDFILSKMPEWRDAFYFRMMRSRFYEALASAKITDFDGCGKALEETISLAQVHPELYERFFRVDGLAATIRTSMADHKDKKETREKCAHVESLLKKLLGKPGKM
jgi:curved DNA-binding protein CbpA